MVPPAASPKPGKPTLSLCMIVRNEERYLEECLRSVEGVVDEIVLVDTGSTDGTLAIAERLGAKIVHFAWSDDFATARNVSLRHATGDWILVLDADERLESASKHLLPALLLAQDVSGYSLICENLVGEGHGDQSQQAPVFRLLRNRTDIYFEGMIHEQAILSAKRTGLKTCASEVRILHLGYMATEVAQRDKRQRNLALLERQVEAEPENPFVHFNLGEVLKLLGRFEAAEEQYRSALALLKQSGTPSTVSYVANLYFSLGDLYREMGCFSEAHELLDEAISLYPTFADLYYTKGFTYFDAGCYTEAIAQFEQCPRFDGLRHPFASDPAIPGHKALQAIADCHIKTGDRKQAKNYLERALRLHTNPEANLWANLGILWLEEGIDVEAEGYFEKAIEQDPQELRSWLNILHLWLQREDYPAAMAAWKRRPDLADCQALMVVAFALSDQGLPLDRPNDETLVRAWCDATELAIVRERTGMVQAMLDRLEVLGATFPGLELALGHVFLRHRLTELALEAFLMAQQRAPEDPWIYCALGDASLAAGSVEDAHVMYAQALALAPQEAYPAQQLADLLSSDPN